MSADWWLEEDGVPLWGDGWNLTYNLNRMLWEAGWRWPYENGEPSTAPQSSLPNFGVWPPALQGMRVSDLGEKVLFVVTQLRERPDHYKQWNPPNEWGNYDQALEVFESFLAAIEAHPNATIGMWI